LAQHFDVHANQINSWKMQLTKAGAGIFRPEQRNEPTTPPVDLEVLDAKDWRACAGERFLSGAHQSRFAERKTMIGRNHNFSLIRQARLLNISRGSVYHPPRAVLTTHLAVHRRIDELQLNGRFAGRGCFRAC